METSAVVALIGGIALLLALLGGGIEIERIQDSRNS